MRRVGERRLQRARRVLPDPRIAARGAASNAAGARAGCVREWRQSRRVVSWDEKFFFIEHRVERDGKQYAVGLFRGLFKSGAATVPAERLFKELGASVGSPPAPPAIERWKEMDGALLPAEHP